MSASLIDRSIPLSPALAQLVGRTPALFLQQLYYWLNKSNHTVDGQKWVYNTLEEWAEQLGASISTMKRCIAKLRELGLIRVMQYRESEWDQTNWYSLDFERLKPLIFSIGSFWTDRSGHFEPIDQVILNHSYTETSTDISATTTPPNHPVEVVGVVKGNEQEEFALNPSGVSGQSAKFEGANQNPEWDKLSDAEKAQVFAEVETEIAPEKLHPGLKAYAVQFSLSSLQQALEVVRDRKRAGAVKNPAGLLRSALDNSWTVAKETPSVPTGFNAWFERARQSGLVGASTLIDGVMHCLTADDRWVPWQQLATDAPVMSNGIS